VWEWGHPRDHTNRRAPLTWPMVYTEEHVSWCSLSQLKTIYDSFILLPIDLMWSKSINSWRKSFEINRLQKLLERNKKQNSLNVNKNLKFTYLWLMLTFRSWSRRWRFHEFCNNSSKRNECKLWSWPITHACSLSWPFLVCHSNYVYKLHDKSSEQRERMGMSIFATQVISVADRPGDKIPTRTVWKQSIKE